MNGRKLVGWMLVLVAVCGLGIAGFSAGKLTACSWGCVYSGKGSIDIYDPSYDILLVMPNDKGVEMLAAHPDSLYCGTSANVACTYYYPDGVVTECAPYYSVLRKVADWNYEEAEPLGTFNIPGCTECT